MRFNVVINADVVTAGRSPAYCPPVFSTLVLMLMRSLALAFILASGSVASAQDRKFEDAIKFQGNCAVAEAISAYSDPNTTSILEIRCDGTAALWRKSSSRYKQGVVQGEFVGVPLAVVIDPEDLTAFLKLPPEVGVRSTAPHGTTLRLAMRQGPADNFVVVQLPSLDGDGRDPKVITFQRTWNQVWNGIDWPPVRFR
jgi:hypothetical protein